MRVLQRAHGRKLLSMLSLPAAIACEGSGSVSAAETGRQVTLPHSRLSLLRLLFALYAVESHTAALNQCFEMGITWQASIPPPAPYTYTANTWHMCSACLAEVGSSSVDKPQHSHTRPSYTADDGILDPVTRMQHKVRSYHQYDSIPSM